MPRTTVEMSSAHELYLASVISGRRTPGSGNQFANQMDVRNDVRRQFHALALDGKSTMGDSLTLKRSDLEKALAQAHDESPGFGLRWYHDETLRRATDLIAVWGDTFAAILQDARAYRDLRRRAGV